MKKLFLYFLLFAFSACSMIHSQDTLPRFTLKNAGNNRIIIGWVNTYPDVRQISIQRSADSLNFYKTILTVPDARAIQNGYLDANAMNDHMFYRLFILLDQGVYLFSAAKKPVPDTARNMARVITKPDISLVKGKPVILPEKPAINAVDKFHKGDSAANHTYSNPPPDAFTTAGPDTVLVKGKPVIVPARPIVIKIENLQWSDSSAIPAPHYTKPPADSYTPSLHVYTNRDGYVRINLPDDEKLKKYSIKFFEDGGSFLFELKEIKEKDFKIDKTGFYHAGWFRFELYENGKLVEKNKFYLEKDF